MDPRSEELRKIYLNDPVCKPTDSFSDDRGEIIHVCDEEMKSCVFITSKKGTVRANHFHKTDWHYCFVTDGEIEYYYRETGDNEEPKVVTVKKGQCFFTPPMVDHAMKFNKDTTFVCLGRNPRDQKSYEADIERIELA